MAQLAKIDVVDGMVELEIAGTTAVMTPEQARHLALGLDFEADRAERN